MPYLHCTRKAEVFMQHKGVKVYHTYKDDEFDQGTLDYWYTLDPYGSSYHNTAFDVRDLAAWRRNAKMQYATTRIAVKVAIRAALDSGELDRRKPNEKV